MTSESTVVYYQKREDYCSQLKIQSHTEGIKMASHMFRTGTRTKKHLFLPRKILFGIENEVYDRDTVIEERESAELCSEKYLRDHGKMVASGFEVLT